MAVFSTADAKVMMPRNIAEGLITKVRDLSVLARLSSPEPMLYGEKDYIIFNDIPEAEFVEEGAAKASTTGSFTSVTAKPYKAQVTMRFNEEVQWADDDYQLGVFNALAGEAAKSLARGLDFGAIHRLNPLSGQVLSTWTNYIGGTSLRVVQDTADADADFRAAVGLLLNGTDPVNITGAAFDPKFAWALANLMAKDGSGETSQRRYPSLGFGTNITAFEGLPVAQGDTVSASRIADQGVRAIVGDFENGFRWGIQRELPVEIIRYGDPDGQGDLKRRNQIALRVEAVYGWYAFLERFALIGTDSMPAAPAAAEPAGTEPAGDGEGE